MAAAFAAIMLVEQRAFAQGGTGANEMSLQDVDFYLNQVVKVTQPSGETIPSRVKNTRYLPRVRAQQLASCGAYAPTYYYKTYQEAREHNWVRPSVETDPQHVMSPGFTFPLANGGLNQGASVVGTMRTILKHGVAPWSVMPENPYDYSSWPTEAIWRSAIPYRGDKVGSIDTSTAGGIQALKEHLAAGDPAVIVIGPVDECFDGYPAARGDVIAESCGAVRANGHAVTVVGYDDDKSIVIGGETKQGAFLIVNSWGTAWGIQEPAFGGESWTLDAGGYAWVEYDYFRSRVGEALFMEDRVAYEPHTLAVFGLTHPRRLDLDVTLLGGEQDDPLWSITLMALAGGSFPFTGRIVTDISDATDGGDFIYWLRVFDAAIPQLAPVTGSVDYFAIERSNGGDRVAGDLPVSTIDFTYTPPYGYVYAGIHSLRPSAQDLEELVDVNYGAQLAWADIDNDGDQDAVVGGFMYGLGHVTTLIRNDSGNFVDAAANLPGVQNGSYAWGDFDNDGFVDLALCGGTATDAIAGIYRNAGGRGLRDLEAGLPGRTDCSVAWGDVDNDGRLDLALIGRQISGGDRCEIYRQGGDSEFSLAWSGECTRNRTALLADLDNDGRIDLLSNNLVYRNLGNWQFETLLPFGGFGNIDTRGTAVGDLNGDGRLDAALIGFERDLLTPLTKAFYNTGGMSFSESGADLKQLKDGALAFGDANNDGRQDLALTGYRHDGLSYPIPYSRLYINRPSTGLVNSGADLTDVWEGGICLVDAEGDNDLDLALAGSGAYPYPLPNNFKLYVNAVSETRANYQPLAPGSLWSEQDSGAVILRWSAGSDVETPTSGLFYNVRVGTEPGGCDVVSPAGGFTVIGNRPPARVGSEAGIMLQSLKPGVYYFAVQTIGAAGDRSSWSNEQQFSIAGSTLCDANADNRASVQDVFALVNSVYGRGSLSGSGDADGDGKVTGLDIKYLFNYYFQNGAAPQGSCARSVG